MSETTNSREDSAYRTQLLSPRDAIDIAWARTDELSTNEDIRKNAERAKKRMDEIIAIAEKGSDEKEKRYIRSAYVAIESAYRNLITITNGRNNNYNEIRELRKQQSEDIQSLATFGLSLRSTLPKVAEMTIGGISVGTLFNELFVRMFPSLGPSAFLIFLALGAAIAYVISETIINPEIVKMKQNAIIKLDYELDLYYQQYVKRSKKALIALYDYVERLHATNFNEKYNEKTNAIIEVDKLFAGIDTTMCIYVSTCFDEKNINHKNWAICESGETTDKCDHFKKMRES